MLIYPVVALTWSFVSGVTGSYDTDMIVNMTLSFASRYDVSCIKFLSDKFPIEEHKNYEIYKRLATTLFKTTGLYSYESYIEATHTKSMRKTCFKPIKLVIESDKTKERFTSISNDLRMSESLWFIILTTPITEFLSDAILPFDIELIVAEVKDKDLVEFKEVYRVDQDRPLRILDYGKWTRSDGLEVPISHLYERRSDLEGKLLKAGSIENWPMSSFKGGVWDGYFPRIWSELAFLINSTTVPYRDNSTGSIKGGGKWNGLVSMVLDGSIDVIVAELSINRERSKVLTFARPVLMTKYRVYFTAPGQLLKWGSAFEPFSYDVWLALLAWVIIGTISMFYCYRFSWLYGPDYNARKIFDVKESFFFVLQTLCQQGYDEVPHSIACRIIILTCFLVSSVLIPSYSASVISSLTYVKPDKPFDTLEEMLQLGTHKLLVIPNSGQYDHFKTSNDPLYREILHKLIDTVPSEYKVKSISEALEKAFCKLNQYAFFSTEKIFEMKIEYSPVNCPLIPMAEMLTPVYQSFAFRKRSPYRDLVNYHLQRLFDSGVINRIENNIRRLRYFNFKPVYSDVNEKDAFQIFFLFACGLILSSAVLLFEKGLYLRKRGRKGDEHETLRLKQETLSKVSWDDRFIRKGYKDHYYGR